MELYEVENRPGGEFEYTNALHRDSLDRAPSLFRFVAYNERDEMRVFRMSAVTKQIEQLD